MVTETDIGALRALLRPLSGQRAWGVSLGLGSFLTLEFGEPLVPGRSGRAHGEWHLWLYGCGWRIDGKDSILMGSEDPRPTLKTAVKRLEGLTLLATELAGPALDATFVFEGGIDLRVFALRSVEMESWMLFTPEHKVAVIGPGSRWTYESASSTGGQRLAEASGPET